jgi:hypothetical protein
MKASATVATLFLALAVTGCQSVGSPRYSRDDTTSRTALQGQTIRLNGFYQLALDCANRGAPDARIVSSVSGGAFVARVESGFPNFRADNPRARCNFRRHQGRAIYYTPRRGFTGTDRVVFELFWRDGDLWRETYNIEVR